MAITIRNGKAQQLPCVITFTDKIILERIDRKNTPNFNKIMESKKFVQLNFGVDEGGDFSFDMTYNNIKFPAKRNREKCNEKENHGKRQKYRVSTGEELKCISENNFDSVIDTIVHSFDVPNKISPIKDLADANIEQKMFVDYKINEKNSLASSTSQIEKAFLENSSKNDDKNTDKCLSAVNVEDKIEKRMMMQPVTKKEIDDFNFDFFEKKLSEQRTAIKSMSHAKRFWLAIKFGTNDNLQRLKMKRQALCYLFGIGLTTLKRYLPKDVKQPYDLSHFNYLSPVEFEHTRQQHFFAKYASNYDALIEQGFFKK